MHDFSRLSDRNYIIDVGNLGRRLEGRLDGRTRVCSVVHVTFVVYAVLFN